MKITPCPFCGRNNDMHTSLTDNDLVPKSGDITLCIQCGEIAEFTEDGLIPLPEEKIDLINLQEIQAARSIRIQFLKRKAGMIQ